MEHGWSRIKVLGETGMAGVRCRCQKGRQVTETQVSQVQVVEVEVLEFQELEI